MTIQTIPDEPAQRAAYVALALTPGLGARLPDIITACSTPLGAISAPIAFLGAAGLSEAGMAAVRGADLSFGRRVLERAAAIGAVVLLPGDPQFPERLVEIPEPPRMLFAFGNLGLLRQPAIAVVGSRNHTDYGLHACRLVVDAVVTGRAVVVSGMARGIDAIAQERALDVGGSTIGILGNGFGVIYPAANRALYERVGREGLLLSELPPGERPRIYTFPHRNRLIAGLATLTVVVEAARTSGSLITATAALDAGRDVMAVPGPITAVTSEGTNALIRDGAAPFTCADDIWNRLPAAPPERMALLMATQSTPAPRRLPEGLSEGERRIAAVLAESEQDIDGIARQTGLDTSVALSELLSLELREVIEARPGRRYRLR